MKLYKPPKYHSFTATQSGENRYIYASYTYTLYIVLPYSQRHLFSLTALKLF
jgi:hypothetical protein